MTEETAPYGNPLSFPDNDAEAAARLQCVFTICGCRSQAELAQILGVRQSSISDAKRRGIIPSPWLLTLLCKKWINPAWILTGRGAHYVRPADYSQPSTPPVYPTPPMSPTHPSCKRVHPRKHLHRGTLCRACAPCFGELLSI